MQTQDANGLLDAVIAQHQLKNDAALARMLRVSRQEISNLRHNRARVGLSLAMRCMDIAGMTLPEVRKFVPSPYVGDA